MERHTSETDWRVFRELREVALQRFCEQILAEVGRVATATAKTAHQGYLQLYKLIEQRDEQIGQAFNNPRRSVFLDQLATIVSLNLLTDEELQRFSEMTRDTIAVITSL